MAKADEITWSWRGETIRLGVSRLGTGPAILLLPALSAISTRLEMRPLRFVAGPLTRERRCPQPR